MTLVNQTSRAVSREVCADSDERERLGVDKNDRPIKSATSTGTYSVPKTRASFARTGVAFFAIACILIGISVGAYDVGPLDVMNSTAYYFGLIKSQPLDNISMAVLWDIRIPRVLLAGLIGGTLAICGGGYQGVFRNSLADPYLLGAAAGAGFGATLVIAFLGDSNAHYVLQIAAFVGALAGVAISYGLAYVSEAGHNNATLVLSGVATTALFTALQTFVQQSHTDAFRAIYGWILGQLGRSDWQSIVSILPYVAFSVIVLLINARALDVLSIGNDKAASLGVNVKRVRLAIIVAASLGTAAAVSVSGLIGFVGIVVPHIARRLTNGTYKQVLPFAFLGGAGFLILADVIARTILAPAELPIGVVTAFVGAPFFAALLRVKRAPT